MKNDCQNHQTQMGIRLVTYKINTKWVLYIKPKTQNLDQRRESIRSITCIASSDNKSVDSTFKLLIR